MRYLALVLGLLLTTGVAMAAPTLCTISGTVYGPSGSPLPNGTINFDSVKTQVIGGQQVARVVKSTTTDPNGVMTPISLTQTLAMQVAVCDQSGTCNPTYGVIIPAAATGDFAKVSQGTNLVGIAPKLAGTFMPALITDGTHPYVTYSAQIGYWSIVGDIEYIFLRVATTGISGGTGNVLYTYNGAGAPCAAIGTGVYGEQIPLGMALMNGITLDTGYTYLATQVLGGTSNAEPVQGRPNGPPNPMDISHWSTGGSDYQTSWTCRTD